MKSKTFLASIVALSLLFYTLCANINASEITTTAINTDDLNSSSLDNSQYYEKAIQSLINRVEVLEHKINAMSAERQPEPGAASVADVDSGQAKSTVAATAVKAKSEAQLYEDAMIAFKANDFAQAEKDFDSFIKKYPKSTLQSNAHYWYAETFFKRQNFQIAAVNYLKGYKQYPKGSKASDSLLKLSMSLGSIKKTKEACSILAKLDREFPNRSSTAIKRSKEMIDKYGCK